MVTSILLVVITSAKRKLNKGKKFMEFELWLFAVKQLAQSYEMSQVIYSQLTDAEKEDLHKEYDATIGGGSSGVEKKEPEKKSRKTSTENYGYIFKDVVWN